MQNPVLDLIMLEMIFPKTSTIIITNENPFRRQSGTCEMNILKSSFA